MHRFFIRVLIVIFIFSVIFILKTSISAGSKLLIAVPYFKTDGVQTTLSKTLAVTLQAEFEKSGKINTKGRDDVKKILAQMKEFQTLGAPCTSDEKCIIRLGQKMQVGYIADSQISKIGDSYIISVRLLPILEDLEIPVIQKQALNENEILSIVRKIAEEIATRFPLEGNITAVSSDGEAVVINLGSSNNLKKGDIFFIEREMGIKNKIGEIEFSDRKKIGKIKLTRIQNIKSKASIIDMESKFKEDDIAVLDQEALIERLENERKEEAERIATIQVAKMDAESSSRRKNDLMKKSSVIRAGYGGLGLIRIADEKVDKYYGSGQAFLFDWFVSRRRDYGGDGTDLFFRYMYKKFEMDDSAVLKLQNDYPPTGSPEFSKGNLTINCMDFGLRYITGAYFLYELWQIYISASLRFAFINESADSGIEKTFISTGGVAGIGFEITIFTGLGIFCEYNIGYTPTGDSKTNVEGNQVLFGLTIRS